MPVVPMMDILKPAFQGEVKHAWIAKLPPAGKLSPLAGGVVARRI